MTAQYIRVLLGMAVVSLVLSSFARAVTLPLDSVSTGHRLAQAWCKDCHAIEPTGTNQATKGPPFAAIARLPSTTALSLKVFLQTSHPTMPNIVIGPKDADDLVNYILSLRP